MKQFTYYWVTGKREVLEGTSASDALTKAGYGNGAMNALDFYTEGVDTNYKWNSESRNWERKER